MKPETLTEVIKASPPAGVGSLTMWGIPSPTWLTLLTIAYTIFLLIDKLPVVIERLKQFARWIKGVPNEQGDRG